MLRLKGAPFCTAFTIYRDHDPSGQNEETGIWVDIAADGRPNVLGYQGFLERLRFAVDPAARRFYFGKL